MKKEKKKKANKKLSLGKEVRTPTPRAGAAANKKLSLGKEVGTPTPTAGAAANKKLSLGKEVRTPTPRVGAAANKKLSLGKQVGGIIIRWTASSVGGLPKSFVMISIMMTMVVGGGSAFIFSSIYKLQGIKSLEEYKPSVITRVYDTKGRLIDEFYKERRELVAYRHIHPDVIRALLATEDKRFFTHLGIDPVRIVKAVIVNILAMRKEQGGSTLTIQLSKLLFLDYQKTFERKIKELWYGVQIEKQYSKQEILAFYLNELNYGHGSYGVEAASEYFFGKSVRRLNLGEAALLAAIPKSPKYYSPLRYRENAMRRHRIVLMAMVTNGHISLEEASVAYQGFWSTFLRDLRSRRGIAEGGGGEAPYFTEYIREKLERDLSSQKVYQEGINVYTTLNLDHQRSARLHLSKAIAGQNRFYKRSVRRVPEDVGHNVVARLSVVGEILGVPALMLGEKISARIYEEVVDGQLRRELRNLALVHGLGKIWKYTQQAYGQGTLEVNDDTAEGAFLSMDPQSGYITAMIGGNTFNYYNQFNRAMLLRRQIGSTLKPFVYGVAMERGVITAGTHLRDIPTSYGGYIPKNYSGKHSGDVLVRDALKRSINILAVEVAHRTGLEAMRDDLSRIFLAVTDRSQQEMFPKNLTFALGSGSFSPLTLATAYAVLANEGGKVLPRTIRYVTDNNGEMIQNYEADYLDEKEERLLSRETSFIITDIIRDVFRAGGTAYIPKLLKDFEHKGRSFGKTGTTSNWTDVWFAGANKALAAVVWIGYDDNRSLGRGRTGGSVAAPVWIRFQSDVLNGTPVEPILPPKGVVKKRICHQLGTLAGPYTRRGDAYNEYFKLGTEPRELCDYRKQDLKRNDNFTRYVSGESKKQSRFQLQLLKAAVEEVAGE